MSVSKKNSQKAQKKINASIKKQQRREERSRQRRHRKRCGERGWRQPIPTMTIREEPAPEYYKRGPIISIIGIIALIAFLIYKA